MRSLAILDSILSPEWEYRYYGFNSKWSEGEMMGSMRNGSGDHWFAIFCAAGVAIQGLAHEASVFRPGNPWPGIFDDLPDEFHANLLREPAFTTTDSTFCVWRRTTDTRWRSGSVSLPAGPDPDGSENLLSILAGDPNQYVAFAADYYERDLALADVSAIYRHEPFDSALVQRLNPATSFDALAEDAAEIGYPERL